MSVINLYEYVRNGLILKNLEEYELFDAIIYENTENIEKENMHGNIYSMKDLGFDFGISGGIRGLKENYKNILIIIEQLNYHYLLPFIQDKNNDINFTIINLGSGLSGYGNKIIPDLYDIGVIYNFSTNIIEPYDFISFFEAIKKGNKNYIRIFNKDISMNLFGTEGGTPEEKEKIVSLKEYELAGNSGTIITTSGMLPETINAVQNIQSNEGEFYDVFCIYDYKFNISRELSDSLLNTEKLKIILDHQSNNIFENIIKSKLWDNGLFDIDIDFIYPSFEKINTTVQEYLYETAEFGSNGLYNKILKK